jgi:choline dehydrogenase
VAEGVELARSIVEQSGLLPAGPMKDVPRSREAVRQFIRDNAWGHHASCTCPMGPKDPKGADADRFVLDSELRVRGTKGLRVVDASIFPKIPGLFIVTAIYMASEKAADVILAASR